MAFPEYTLPSGAGGTLCAICQSVIRPEESTRVCDACGLTYHADCWRHNEGCGTYGCRRAPDALKLTVASESAAGAWGDLKACPNCGEELPASALKCPRCKAAFETRAPMAPEDYQAQLARASASKRDAILAALLLAASTLGVTAPATLPIGGAWALARRRSARRGGDTAGLLIAGALLVSLAYDALLVAIFGFGW